MVKVDECAYCHKPLVKKNVMQKYHLECGIKVSKEQAREYWRIKKENNGNHKNKHSV